jgi:hypothetical protein
MEHHFKPESLELKGNFFSTMYITYFINTLITKLFFEWALPPPPKLTDYNVPFIAFGMQA